MRLAIRVGDTLTDLNSVHRLKVEDIGGLPFLTGVKNSGRVIVLYGIRPESRARVMEGINAAMGSNRHVCVLTDELYEIADREEAIRAIDHHNAFVGGIKDEDRRERPNTAKDGLVYVDRK